MKRILLLVMCLCFMVGCTAVPIAKDNTGIKVGDVGFVPHDIATQQVGRDFSLGFVGGNIGLTLIGLALCGVAYKAVANGTSREI